MKELFRHSCLLLTLVLVAGLFWSCGSSNVPRPLTADERFQTGKQKFFDGDYLEAITEFEAVKLQFAGSAVADSAQYFLGECHFKREEYLLASEEYQGLRRNFTTSSLAPLAQYKIALSYYNLSPNSYLDQKYTVRAVDELQAFIEYYPKHELVHDAELKIQELDARLARKEYESGELYMKLDYYKAATYYFNTVVDKYHDTPYAEPALLGKIKALVARRKYDEAKPEAEKFLAKYRDSKLRPEVESILKYIQDRLNGKSAGFSPDGKVGSTC